MSTPRPRGVAAIVAASLAALAAAGCGGDEKLTEVERAQDGAGFPMLWLGETFRGHEVHDINGEESVGGMIYGDCDPGPGIDASCSPPYELQQQDICEWEALERRPPLRGGPGDSLLFDEGGGLVVITGPTYVKIFGEQPLEAARALRPLGQSEPLAKLPPPVTEVDPELCDAS